MSTTCILPTDLINRIGQYLSYRPFREVSALLLELDVAMKDQPARPSMPEHGEG